MIKQLFEAIERENQDRIEKYGATWSLSSREIDLEELLQFIIKYFELDSVIKEKWDFEYPNERDYMRQKHKYLNYVQHFLYMIKPMLLLAYRLSKLNDTSEMFEKGKISEDAIVNMVDNFLRLERTGRPRKFYPSTLEEFKKFKQKYQNHIDFFSELKKPHIKSIKDYAETIMKFNITLAQLREYKLDYKLKFKRYVDECSEKTLYRYDKTFIFIRETIYTVEWLEHQWAVYSHVDKEYFSIK
jgi:hypothetical protein